jgi:drug/metabolite transporter (DMT)-like permease
MLELRGDGTMKVTPKLALLLTLPPLLWAGNAVVGRLVVGTVPPLLLNGLRWTLAALLLLPLGWRVLGTSAARHEVGLRWKELALLSFLGVGCYNALQYLALTTSTPVNVTLIAASSPLWMMAIGILFYREHPRRREWAGAAFSLLGVLVVLSRGHLETITQVRFVGGDLLMLVAVFTWALYSWQLARPPAALRPESRPAWNWAEMLLLQTLFGAVFGMGAAGVEHVATGAELHWKPWVWLVLAYVAIGPSLIAYRCWGMGVAAVGPSVAAFFANLTPLFAAVMSAAVLGEMPQLYHVLAFGLIVAGIAVSSRR